MVTRDSQSVDGTPDDMSLRSDDILRMTLRFSGPVWDTVPARVMTDLSNQEQRR